mgnify:CR=1 FL=1
MTIIASLLRAADLPDSPTARLDAELLLAAALGKSRSYLHTWPEKIVSSEHALAFAGYLQRRRAGEPVAYILGQQGFWKLDLEVAPHTLIPRPDTELLVEAALELLPATPVKVLDLGTGSGAIALALASERPQAQVLATDASSAALAVAARNAARHELGNVRFAEGGHDWYAPLHGERFDLIASNPPYIASDDPHLQQGDLRFEPATALASGVDGLDDIRRIIVGGGDHLQPGGWLLIEHGWDQGDAIGAETGDRSAAPVAAHVEDDRVAPVQFAGIRVLLAEDNPVGALLARTLLRREGCTVETAATGDEAVAALKRARYDVVFMDMRMPGMDGPAAARAIRAAGDTTPILALTANAFAEDRRACLEAGMDDHIVKPLDAEALRAALARWTKRDIRAKVG